jgi:hypothetical protein
MCYPPALSNIAKRRSGQKPNGGHYHFTIDDEMYFKQLNLPGKLLYLQRLKFEKDGRLEPRLGYYIIGKKPAMRGRWVQGEFATMMPVVDFRRIMNLAKQKRWLP